MRRRFEGAVRPGLGIAAQIIVGPDPGALADGGAIAFEMEAPT